ncbi:hypothetical protein T484DRAFT_1848205 [Baffinella frigidus]|nr:hypothetical protein T484DRAFT_1848205 [Cryptophyta sp. CCMP2293]
MSAREDATEVAEVGPVKQSNATARVRRVAAIARVVAIEELATRIKNHMTVMEQGRNVSSETAAGYPLVRQKTRALVIDSFILALNPDLPQGLLPSDTGVNGLLPYDFGTTGLLPYDFGTTGLLPHDTGTTGLLPYDTGTIGLLPYDTGVGLVDGDVLPGLGPPVLGPPVLGPPVLGPPVLAPAYLPTDEVDET